MRKLRNGKMVVDPQELDRLVESKVREKMGRSNTRRATTPNRKQSNSVVMSESVLVDKIERIVKETLKAKRRNR